jgi:FixJ family two-component response regulator
MARPEFKPTAEQRRQVMTCHAVGMSNRDIATAIGIDEKTLTKHFCYDAVADVLLRNPTTGIAGCCACAASGHATALLSSVMNSRLPCW